MSRGSNKKTEKKEHITRFEYVFEQTPDTYFYEDGKLRIKTVYDNLTDFTKTFFFDGGFSVVCHAGNPTFWQRLLR